MKKDEEKILESKRLLQSAMKLLPSTHEFSDARVCISNALRHIEHNEKRETRREKQSLASKWQETIKSGLPVGMGKVPNINGAVGAIDKLIQIEQDKLNNMEKAIERETSPEILSD